ncbi:hypothetical protein SLEP1_g12713 [Rubroshorea leprosula]|uniref:SWIM-type domain-containing protein n=1 Tax=Rubroshorea leprosula TaxID=152421 RepID=A0AAV5IM58_9ROSI|nr:hypothetical protein SLEP1_g12713 [Rubroshorea leprosula]
MESSNIVEVDADPDLSGDERDNKSANTAKMFLHVGGRLVQNEGLKYVDGECYVWNVDPEKITVWEFYRKVEFCKYDPDMVDGIWYLQHGKTLEDGLVRIVNDDSVREVLEIIKVVNVIHVYILHVPDFAHVEEEVLLLPAPGDDQKEDNDDATDNVQPNVTEESVGADGAAANVTEEGVGVKTHDGDAVTDDGVRVESDDDEEDHIIDVPELTDNEDEETLQARKNVKFFNNIEDSIEKDLERPTVDVKYSDAHTTGSSAGGPSGQHLDEVDEIGSDEEDSYLSTSDDEASEAKHGKRRRATHKVYQEAGDDETPDIRLGMMFTNKQQFRDAKNKRCSSTVAAKHLVRHRGFTALYMRRTDIYNVIRKEFSVELSDHQLKKVKEKIGKAFEGDCKMEYAGCRRVIGLDGAFLKGAFKGVLLVAISRDANNQMYPLAWAAVEGETTETWIWFLEELQKDMVIGSGSNFTFISDQQKGLIHAIEDLFPDAEHRTCARHKYANFRKNNGGKELKVAFWRCVKANTKHDFNRALTELGRIKPSSVPAIMSTHPRFWSKAFFKEDSKCDVVDNMCEVFNRLILEVRHKVIFSMLEDLRAMCGWRTVARREYGNRKFVGNFGRKIWAKLVPAREGSKRCTLLWPGGDGYEVDDNGEATYIVNVERKTCTCRVWNMTGIPCRHAVTVINHKQENDEDYVAHWYSKHMFMASYEYEVPVIEGINQWKETKMPPMQPPNPRKMPGRPKKKRQQEEWEGKTSVGRKGRLMTCQKCFKRGHNSRSCKGVPPNIQEQNEDQATPQEEQPQGVDENIGANVENPMSQVEDPLSQVLNETPTPNRFKQTAKRKQEVCEGSSKNAQPQKRAKKDYATTTTGPSQPQAPPNHKQQLLQSPKIKGNNQRSHDSQRRNPEWLQMHQSEIDED